MSRLVIALDTSSLRQALAWARELAGEVDGFKVGLELLMGAGPTVIADVASLGRPVFVDAKLHDIPNTVAGATRQLGAAGARWVTVHASGGREMMTAAVEGLTEASGGEGGVLAVTVLTSLDDDGLHRVGVDRPVAAQVERLASLAAAAGVEGVVCSVAEATRVRALHSGLLIATPGIRDRHSPGDDQARVAGVEAAVAAGSDLLVVGRPVTRAPHPVGAAREMKRRIGAVGPSPPPSSPLWSDPPRRREDGTTTPTE